MRNAIICICLFIGGCIKGQDWKENDWTDRLFFSLHQHTYLDYNKTIIDNRPDFKALYSRSWGWEATLRYERAKQFIIELGYGNRYIFLNKRAQVFADSPFDDPNIGFPRDVLPHARREYILVGFGYPLDFALNNRLNFLVSPTIQVYRYFSNYKDSIARFGKYRENPAEEELSSFLYSTTVVDLNGGKFPHYQKLPFVPVFQLSTSLNWYLPKKDKYISFQLSYQQTVNFIEPESSVDLQILGVNGELLEHLRYQSFMRSVSLGVGLSF